MGLEKIIEYKKTLGLTNEELSKLSGVPRGTLDKILSGVTKDPKLGTLKSLAKVFNCTLDDFNDKNDNKCENVLSKNETTLLESYNKLNETGKTEAVKRVTELTYVKKYINIENNIMSLEEARKYLSEFKGMAAFGGDDINVLSDEEIISRAIALRHEFEEVPHKYKK